VGRNYLSSKVSHYVNQNTERRFKMSTKKVVKPVGKNTVKETGIPSKKLVLPAVDFSPTIHEKSATILYKKLPDNMILIVGFENFLTIDDIMNRYGMTVAKIYADFPCHMAGKDSVVSIFDSGSVKSIATNQIYRKSEFSKIVSDVKKCGGLLHDIIVVVNGGEVKRIQI